MVDNIRTYDDKGTMFGAFFSEGVPQWGEDASGVVYEWNFIGGVLSMTVYVGEYEF